VALLLLLRKANRLKAACALLIPLFAIYSVLAVVERQLNGYLVFHYHQYICSALADLLRYFALSLAILLAIADRLDIPWRPVRFALVFLLLLLSADVQIASNGWPFLDTAKWALIFTLILLLFMTGHSLLHAVLRRWVKPARFRWWYGAFCLVFGLVPLLTLGAVEACLSRSPQLQSTQEQFRIVVVLTGAIAPPYLVFFAFILLALRSPLYCDRLARAFGLTRLASESMPRPASPDAPLQLAPERLASTRPQPHET
jgi:hypothetical protein